MIFLLGADVGAGGAASSGEETEAQLSETSADAFADEALGVAFANDVLADLVVVALPDDVASLALPPVDCLFAGLVTSEATNSFLTAFDAGAGASGEAVGAGVGLEVDGAGTIGAFISVDGEVGADIDSG